ncbi:MAG TPA: hypothetical protein VN458_05160 [Solirubrobacterales bacterium]|nr:hypothetical protein [Solirubrobacterales bacterium]
MFSNPSRMVCLRLSATLALACVTALAILSRPAVAGSGGTGLPAPTVQGSKAKLVNGKAVAPKSAPGRVKRVIDAANEIAKGHGYCSGGYAHWKSPCYDCSSAVSFALHGGDLINRAKPPTGLMRWGRHGRGRWITVYANSGHAFMKVAGLRFDTADTRGSGPGWARGMGWERTQTHVARHKGKL